MSLNLKNLLTSYQKEAIKDILRNGAYCLWKIGSLFRRKIDTSKIKKVLVVNLGVIGDNIVATPMIRALAEKYGKVDVLMRNDMEPLMELNPNVRKIISFESFEKAAKLMGEEKYDLAVIFSRHDGEMKKICRKAGVRYVIGNSFSESKQDFFISARTRENPREHFVQKALDEARLAGADLRNPKVELFLDKKDENYVNNLLKKNKIKDYVVMHAGKRGNLEKFLWPSEKWAEVIEYIIDKYGLNVILTGTGVESERNEEIMKLVKSKKVFNFCDKTNLRELAYLIKKAKLLICLNTGASHVASAFGTKTIVLNEEFPEKWHPWMERGKYRILLHPRTEEVEEAIQAFLK